MKAVLQRVLSASVAVDGVTISSIGKGLLVLVGIDRNDAPADSTVLIKKILSAKLFDDAEGKAWKNSVKDIEGEVLCVSQFTLLAQFKGAKPDFHESMSTIPGKAHYTDFLAELGRAYDPAKIKDGQFGAMMQVSLCNDGPVTILLSSLDSRKGASKTRPTPSSSVPASASLSAEGSAASSGMSTPAGRLGKQKKQGAKKQWVELGGTPGAEPVEESSGLNRPVGVVEGMADGRAVAIAQGGELPGLETEATLAEQKRKGSGSGKPQERNGLPILGEDTAPLIRGIQELGRAN